MGPNQGPDTISRESIHVFVRSLTEAPANVLEAARLRQTQLEAQIAAEKPLTARETVLMDLAATVIGALAPEH